MSNFSLLEDYNDLTTFETIKESAQDGSPVWRLRGVFSKADVVNKNRRIYPRSIMEETINSLQPIIENGGFVGELDHPPTQKINMDKISHKITKLAMMEDGSIVGEMVPAGPRKHDLIALLEDGIRCGVSTRGTGKTKPYSGPLGEGLVEVLPGYAMKAIDIVFDPSAGAFPQPIYEATESGILLGGTASFREVWNSIFS